MATVADESTRDLLHQMMNKKESSESGNSPELEAMSERSGFRGGSNFSADDLRRIGMSEVEVQGLMRKIAATRSSNECDGHESDAELHSDSLNMSSVQAPLTPPKTPAKGIASTGTQDTEATLPSSITTESGTEPASAIPAPKVRPGGHPSPIELPPASPDGDVCRASATQPARLNLETPIKREYSFGSATANKVVDVQDSPQLSQDSSCLNTPTNQLSKLGLASPSAAHPDEVASALKAVNKPPPISVPGPLAGLDAISALCHLATTPRAREDEDPAPDTGVEPSPRKRPRRNVERRNWSTLSNESSDLADHAVMNEEEAEEAASNVARALAVAKSPVAGRRSPETIAMSGKVSTPKSAKRSNNSLLMVAAMESPRASEPRDSDEDEEVELETPEDEEDDEEWSPKDGDWSPKGRKGRGRGKGAPRGAPRGKPHRAYPVSRPGIGLDDDIEIPVDIKKGGKVPELIRSKRAASGFVGVDFHEGKWRARVRIGVGIRGQPNRLVIGRYSTAGEAAIAYAKYVNSSAGKKLLAGGRG